MYTHQKLRYLNLYTPSPDHSQSLHVCWAVRSKRSTFVSSRCNDVWFETHSWHHSSLGSYPVISPPEKTAADFVIKNSWKSILDHPLVTSPPPAVRTPISSSCDVSPPPICSCWTPLHNFLETLTPSKRSCFCSHSLDHNIDQSGA